MKRIAALLLAACLCLAACGREEEAPAAEEIEEGVVLNVVTSYGVDDGNRRNYEAAVAGYEAATGNRVNDNSSVSNPAGNSILARMVPRSVSPISRAASSP